MSNSISLEFQALDAYNIAIHNNNISLIEEIIIRNNLDYNLKNLEVEISSSPSFFSSFITKVSDISSGRYIIINNLEIDIDSTKIMYATQLSSSTITVKIKNMGEVLAESSKSILLLPYDFIPPIHMYTELLASYVTPNQEEIRAVVSNVFENLKANSSIPINRDMWNYNDKALINEIIKAIYEAIKGLKITLNTVNILSETKPLQIKFPETTIRYRNGNGFEIAILTASVAELLGINSFIAFTTEKTLIGFFYQQDCFDTCVSDDGRAFLDMVDGDCEKFCIVDTTSMMNGTQILFEDSLITAQKALNSCEYPIVVDICRSRKNGYYPLPNRIRQNDNVIFEITSKNTTNGKNSFDTSVLNNAQTFSDFIKRSIFSHSENNSLLSVDLNRSICLIGNPKYIMSKLFFNGRINLKSFPFSNITIEDSKILEKLPQLNENIDAQDISNSVNVIHEKKSLTKRMLALLDDSKDDFSAICLSLGSVKYLYNGNTLTAPLFTVPVIFEADEIAGAISVRLLSQEVSLNNSLIEVLTRAGLNIEKSLYSTDILENYSNITSQISEFFEDLHGFEFFDVTSISTFSIDSHTLSSLATADYFEQSNILKRMFESLPIEESKHEEHFSVLNYDLPFSLDSTQIKALLCANNSQCTVIKGANCSGKTRVAASIAFSDIRQGKKVLYLTNSEGNKRDFLSLAKLASFDNYVMNITEKSNAVNSFSSQSGLGVGNDVSSQLETVTHDLDKMVNKQNAYFENLHKVNEIGFSLYESASQYERYRSFPYSVNFTNSEICNLTRDDVVGWFDAVSSLAKAGADCKEPHSNPLSYIREKNFSYDLKSRATIALSSHISLTQHFINLQNQLAEFLGIEIPIMKEKQTEIFLKILDCIKNSSESIYHGVFSRISVDSDFSQIEAVVLKCDDLFELKDFLKENFTEDITSIDCEALLMEWRNANAKFAFSRSSALAAVKNKLKSYALNAKFLNNDNFVDIINKIARYKTALSLIDDNASLIYQITGIDIKSMIALDSRDVFLKIKNIISVSQNYLSLITELYDSEQSPKSVYIHQSSLFKNTEKLLNDISGYCNDFSKLYQQYLSSENQLVELLDLDISAAKETNGKLWYYFVGQFLSRMFDSIDLLKQWCNWNIEKERAISLGLGNVISLYESEQITSSDIKNAFLKGFFKSVTEYFLSCEETVSSFSSDSQKDDISTLYFTLNKYRELLSADLSNRVASSLNTYIQNRKNFTLSDAEIILKDNFSYDIVQSANKEAVELLQEAKPCFVCVSPNFITKFNNLPKFDTVIIDCSSEKLQHSLFMLLPLAKKAVILDADNASCNNVNFAKFFTAYAVPTIELGWLYNTNYTSQLVNELFYDNSLSSFVCTRQKKNGLSISHQIGTYDRKKTRVNVIEASSVVDEIFKIRSENPKLSIGVYTMTEEQKTLVEMLYYKRSGTSDAFDKNSGAEPFFIRSFLQAEYDPRDVIVFSTVFSAEERPKYRDTITKTIPELSKSNSITNLIHVLSSARRSFSLVTSLSPDILNNFKTTERNYCIFKKTILRLISEHTNLVQDINTGIVVENSIIREVANHIESLGYKADMNVGINKCKIDIAVKCKGKNNYLLGILFDESAYINSDDFFGRDLIQGGLKDFGKWKLLRIYTVEWFENHSKQLDLISSMLNGDEFENEFSIGQKTE